MKICLIILLHLFLPLFVNSFRKYSCNKLFYYRFANDRICYKNENVLSNVPDMVQYNNYNIKSYEITTSDGYILTLFKISKNIFKNYTIFIQHGAATNSGPWVDIGNRSLAYYFADRGYEVWLGNVRGTTYSNKHKTLSINNSSFWNFNLDTIAEHDITQQLEFIYKINKQKIHYIGHSMGSTLCLMFSSSYPQKATNLLHSISLMAPVAYLDGVFLLDVLKKPVLLFFDFLTAINIKGFFYHEEFIHKFLNIFCSLLPEICNEFLNIVFGKSSNFKSDDLLLYFSYWPSGTSVYQLKQFLQIADSGKFQKFDYGKKENERKYGNKKPPVYDLKKINVPISLYYGENDSLFKKENLEQLLKELGSTKKFSYSVPLERDNRYNHIDFLYGENISKDLYKLIISFIEETEK